MGTRQPEIDVVDCDNHKSDEHDSSFQYAKEGNYDENTKGEGYSSTKSCHDDDSHLRSSENISHHVNDKNKQIYDSAQNITDTDTDILPPYCDLRKSENISHHENDNNKQIYDSAQNITDTDTDILPPYCDIIPPNSSDSKESRYRRRALQLIDSRYAWVQVFAAWLTFFILAGTSRSFSLIYEALLEKYQRSDGLTSVVPALHGAVKLCSSPLIGYLIQRYDERRVCFVGSFFATASIIGMALSPSIELVLLFYGLCYGLSTNACLVSGMTTVAKYFDKRRSRAMGITFSAFSFGALAMSATIQSLLKEYNYFGALLILSGFVLQTSISATIMRPMPKVIPDSQKVPKDDCKSKSDLDEIVIPDNMTQSLNATSDDVKPHANNNMDDVIVVSTEGSTLDIRIRPKSTNNSEQTVYTNVHGYDQSDDTKVAKSKQSQKINRFLRNAGIDLLKNPQFFSFCVFMTLFNMCLDVSMAFHASLLREKGFSDAQLLVSFIFFNCFDIPCQLSSGLMFERQCVRSRKVSFSVIFFFGMAFFLLLFPFALDINFALGMACLSLSSSCRAVAHSQHATVAAEINGRSRIKVGIGWTRFFQGLGTAISPILAGFLKDMTGTYIIGYIVMPSFQITNTIVYFTLKACSCL